MQVCDHGTMVKRLNQNNIYIQLLQIFTERDEGSCSVADYLVISVHLKGSRENVLFPESILNQKSRKRGARRMENLKKSCPHGLNYGLAQLCRLAQFYGFQNALNHFSFEKKSGKKRMDP